jgi:hypothetical protein
VIEPAFRVLLLNDTAINTAVGGRIFHNIRPQDERRPSLVLTRVSTFFARRFGSGVTATRGRMQIDCSAEDYRTVKELAQKVRKRVDGFVGTLEGIRLHLTEVEDEADVPSAPLVGNATPLFVVRIDARFLYEDRP